METFIEILGYLGMALVVLSFTMKNIVLLRVINILGALLSGIYGYITKTYPTGILNTILFIINSYYLIRYYLDRKNIKIKNKSGENKKC